MRIGVYGGSFNPVHEGHLHLARQAASELNLSELYFVPSFETPLTNKALLPPATRLALLRKALEKTNFKVSDCEIKRKGLSFTVDTVQDFRRRHPRAVIYFLAGTDAAAGIRRWKNYRRLLKICRLTVLTRGKGVLARSPEGLLGLELDSLPVSSSQIRRKLKENVSSKPRKKLKS